MNQDTPPFTLEFLGSTEQYDVYDVVLYASLMNNQPALAEYRRRVFENLTRAKQSRHKVWGVVNLSHVSVKQIIALTYRTVLPFVREPLLFRVYGTQGVESDEEEVKTLAWLVRRTFRMAVVPTREAAFPPGFALPVADPSGASDSC